MPNEYDLDLYVPNTCNRYTSKEQYMHNNPKRPISTYMPKEYSVSYVLNEFLLEKNKRRKVIYMTME